MSVKLSEHSEATQEAYRIMTICNACRYCEGFCAVFPAMAMRRDFEKNDLDYLANLCHQCNACYHACQYAPPHEFAVNVPKTLATLRAETYADYAWPQPLARLFARNGLVLSITVAFSLALVMLLVFALQASEVLFAVHTGPGAFYQVISHGMMVSVAGAVFLYSVLALSIGFIRFWRAGNKPLQETVQPAPLSAAIADAASLKYLGGGYGEGCNTTDASFSNQRRWFHQCTMWGFLLCFAATCTATLYDYLFHWPAPYPFFSVPVLLGTVGGIGLLVGPVGLFWIKHNSDPVPLQSAQFGMDYGFLALLFFTSLSGLLLLALRETAAMGTLLAIHLGFVLALFLLMPYSKFVHMVYRFAALLRYAMEQQKQR